MNNTKAANFGVLNLLIYEEYLFISDILSEMLKTLGMKNIHRAKNLIEAKNIFEEQADKGERSAIDFAIVDLSPPNNHGLELMNWIRHHRTQNIQYVPVIFTANDPREKIVFSGRDSGVNEILVKPFTAYNVSQRILSIINNPRAFIQSEGFCGPNRRRRSLDFNGLERRLTRREDIEIVYEAESDKKIAKL
jgi:DNA-binding response OmpR family regulator